jgi:hypothetical protein
MHDMCRHGWGPSVSLIYDMINRSDRRPNRDYSASRPASSTSKSDDLKSLGTRKILSSLKHKNCVATNFLFASLL